MILYDTFYTLQTSYTFSILQKYIRRVDGISAARKLFSDTYILRQQGKLTYEVYIYHAELELLTNNEPYISSQILKLCMNIYKECIYDIIYIRLYIKVLLYLKDIQQIRWLTSLVLGKDANYDHNSDLLHRSSTTTNTTTSTTAANNTTTINSNNNTASNIITSHLESTVKAEETLITPTITSPIHRYLIYNDLLYAETILCQCSIHRLDELKRRRDEAEVAAGVGATTTDSSSSTSGTSLFNKSGTRAAKDGKYSGMLPNLSDVARDIYERYPMTTAIPTSTATTQPGSSGGESLSSDLLLYTRVQPKKGFGPATTTLDPTRRGAAYVSGSLTNGSGAGAFDMNTLPQEGSSHLFRDFMSKLPPYSGGPLPDLDDFIRQLRVLILPPRPVAPTTAAYTGGGESEGGGTGGGTGEAMGVHKKSRFTGNTTTNTTTSDMMNIDSNTATGNINKYSTGGGDVYDDVADPYDTHSTADQGEDVFRQRRRK